MNSHPSFSFYTELSNEWTFNPPPPEELYLYHCQYHLPLYSDDLYLSSGIPFSNKIKTACLKRKAEHLAGRLCAQKALSCLNINELPSSQADKYPIWPSSTTGSITHSHNIAAAIAANKTNWLAVGLDIEQLLSQTRSQKLAPQIMNTQEMDLAREDIALFTTLAFSVKESLFKALYPITKKYFYFHDAEVIDWNNQGEITIKLAINLSNNWKKGTLIKGIYCLKENSIWSLIAINQQSLPTND